MMKYHNSCRWVNMQKPVKCRDEALTPTASPSQKQVDSRHSGTTAPLLSETGLYCQARWRWWLKLISYSQTHGVSTPEKKIHQRNLEGKVARATRVVMPIKWDMNSDKAEKDGGQERGMTATTYQLTVITLTLLQQVIGYSCLFFIAATPRDPWMSIS